MAHPNGSNNHIAEESKKLNERSMPATLSSTTLNAVKMLSVIRIATGAACLIAPRFTCAVFGYSVPAEHALLVRMFGIRDAVLGELLVTAEDRKSSDGGRREMKRTLWAGVAADVVDIGSLAYAVAMGQVGKTTGGLFGACAVGAIGLASLGLRGL